MSRSDTTERKTPAASSRASRITPDVTGPLDSIDEALNESFPGQRSTELDSNNRHRRAAAKGGFADRVRRRGKVFTAVRTLNVHSKMPAAHPFAHVATIAASLWWSPAALSRPPGVFGAGILL
jgi:hypothetical protein